MALRIAVQNAIISSMLEHHPEKPEEAIQHQRKERNTGEIRPIYTSHALQRNAGCIRDGCICTEYGNYQITHRITSHRFCGPPASDTLHRRAIQYAGSSRNYHHESQSQ